MDQNREERILELKDLKFRFYSEEGIAKVLNGINMEIYKGEPIGVVGESGCGKSVTAYSILRVLPPGGRIMSGEINFTTRQGEVIDFAKLEPNGKEIRKYRGVDISMIFQEPMTSFSPVHTFGNQITEAILLHQNITRRAARKRAGELLSLVRISNPEQRLDEYPFQFSGGMRQRAMIAMALACNPRILIADEPTTALDVTTQAQILKLIKEMQIDFNLSLMLITHDLGVIAHMVEYVYIMYLGQILEASPVEEIYDHPKHPYTHDLLKSIPKISGTKGKLPSIQGSVPSSYTLPTGCPFHTRCQKVVGEICYKQFPQSIEVGVNHQVNCFHYSKERVGENVHDAG